MCGAPLACASSIARLCATKVDLRPFTIDFCTNQGMRRGGGQRKTFVSEGLWMKLTHGCARFASGADAVTSRLAVAASKAGERYTRPLNGCISSGGGLGIVDGAHVLKWCIIVHVTRYVRGPRSAQSIGMVRIGMVDVLTDIRSRRRRWRWRMSRGHHSVTRRTSGMHIVRRHKSDGHGRRWASPTSRIKRYGYVRRRSVRPLRWIERGRGRRIGVLEGSQTRSQRCQTIRSGYRQLGQRLARRQNGRQALQRPL